MPANIPPLLSDPAGARNLPETLRRRVSHAQIGAPDTGQHRGRSVRRRICCGSAPGGLTLGRRAASRIAQFHDARPARCKRAKAAHTGAGNVQQLQHWLRIGAAVRIPPRSRPAGHMVQRQSQRHAVGIHCQQYANFKRSQSSGSSHIVPSDLGCPVAANANSHVLRAIRENGAGVRCSIATPASHSAALQAVYWIADGSTVGTGFLHVEGIDFNASYDFDAWRLWRLEYRNHRHLLPALLSGARERNDPPSMRSMPNIPAIGGVAQNGVASIPSGQPGAPRMIYRARLGWSNGAV